MDCGFRTIHRGTRTGDMDSTELEAMRLTRRASTRAAKAVLPAIRRGRWGLATSLTKRGRGAETDQPAVWRLKGALGATRCLAWRGVILYPGRA